MDEMTPAVTVEIGLDDMRAFWDRKKLPIANIVWAVIFYGVIFLVLVLVLRESIVRSLQDVTMVAVSGVLVGITGGGWAWALCTFYYSRREQRKIYEGSLAARGPIEVRGDNEKIEAKQAGMVWVVRWSSFIGMASTPTHYLLFPARLQPIILPRDALANTPLGALVEARVAGGVVSAR